MEFFLIIICASVQDGKYRSENAYNMRPLSVGHILSAPITIVSHNHKNKILECVSALPYLAYLHLTEKNRIGAEGSA